MEKSLPSCVSFLAKQKRNVSRENAKIIFATEQQGLRWGKCLKFAEQKNKYHHWRDMAARSPTKHNLICLQKLYQYMIINFTIRWYLKLLHVAPETQAAVVLILNGCVFCSFFCLCAFFWVQKREREGERKEAVFATYMQIGETLLSHGWEISLLQQKDIKALF